MIKAVAYAEEAARCRAQIQELQTHVAPPEYLNGSFTIGRDGALLVRGAEITPSAVPGLVAWLAEWYAETEGRDAAHSS